MKIAFRHEALRREIEALRQLQPEAEADNP